MSRWLLALHSSSETLGLAVCDAEDPAEGIRILSRPMGRQLTNGLIPAVEELLPQAEWASIGRLAVSTGYRPLPAIKPMGRWSKVSGKNCDRGRGGLIAGDYLLNS